MRTRALSPEDLRVALVHDWLQAPTGAEVVFEQILDLFPGSVFASQIDAGELPFLEGKDLHPSYVQKLPYASKNRELYFPLLPSVYANMDLSGYDLVLSDSHSFAHGVRRRADALHINYYHTPARFLWLPDDDPAKKNIVLKLIGSRLRELDLESAKRPDVIFANSRTTAERVLTYFGRRVNRVIYPPVDTAAWADVQRNGEAEGLLYWGRLIGYKRIDLAIEAAKRTGERLNVVGSGPAEESLKKQAVGLRNVKFWGRVSSSQLKDLVARSRALIFPGNEDFGVVPVESMAAGLPVVAFGEGGVTESVTEECGVLFPEQTVESLVSAITQLGKKTFVAETLKNQARIFDVGRFRREYKEAVLDAVAAHLARR